ncbi:hypothetical protein D5S17_22085 [Pseudonocardiaceae bacterium YIM PH 21723]|nr:hypothetical protein D5S17_22085 [Pseudonocardiaceae bacterium YIM PH 21723]
MFARGTSPNIANFGYRIRLPRLGSIDHMPFAETPLTDAMRAAVTTHWRPLDGPAVRLHGGEDSTAYRIGDLVVRVGPAGRSPAELEWCHAILNQIAPTIPEVITPLPTHSGTTVVQVADRPLSLWPFVEGVRPDRVPATADQAAELLARLHRTGCGRVREGVEPGGSQPVHRAVSAGGRHRAGSERGDDDAVAPASAANRGGVAPADGRADRRGHRVRAAEPGAVPRTAPMNWGREFRSWRCSGHKLPDRRQLRVLVAGGRRIPSGPTARVLCGACCAMW